MIYKELVDADFETLVKFWNGPPPTQEEENLWYSEVAYAIRDFGDPGSAFLLKQLDSRDNSRLAEAIEALCWQPSRGEATPLSSDQQHQLGTHLLSYLDHPHPIVVMRTIVGLASLKETGVKDRVLALKQHASPYVRGGVLMYLTRIFPSEAFGPLCEALSDESYIVRMSAIDELEDLTATEAIPLIRPLLRDPHPDVREAAEWTLSVLSDDDF